MLVNKHIGNDSESGEGIMGDQFTRELMFLDGLGKKSIQVWINSGGGVVTDGEQIAHAILNSKTPVDTVNTGTVASIAGPIFAAGRNRLMIDYSKLMMHPVSGGDEKSTKAFEQTIRTMLSSRSYLSEDQVKRLMNRTTWMNPQECLDLGICTGIIYSNGVNTNKDYNKIVNKLIPKTMNKITNKLGLDENSTEEVVLAKIEAMEVENKSKFDKYCDELAASKLAKEDADSKYNELKAKFDTMESEAKAKAADVLSNEAEVEINEAVKLGKIENKAEAIDKMKATYIANPTATKEILNAIPAKVAGAKLDVVVEGNQTKVWNAASVMDFVSKSKTNKIK